MIGEKTLAPLPSKPPNKQDQVFVKILLEDEKSTQVIDQVYPLSELPEVLRYLGKGHAQGKLVVTVAQCHTT